MKPFEIFRTGRHTSSQGIALSFGEGELAAIAAGYDPANYEAPIVVGHPKQDAPAYGWVKRLEVSGDRLVAVPGDINPEFSDLVRAGSFKARSAAFYRPESANNPTPGQYHLRHVGFLGAEPPAVKGLKAVEFSDADDLIVEFAEGDWNTVWALGSVVRIFRALRDHFVATGDLETADRVVPHHEIDQLAQNVADTRAEIRAKDQPRFSETEPKEDDMTKTAEQRQAELDAREAAIASRETKVKTDEATFAETSRRAQAAADAAFVTEIVTQGRLPIGLQARATALFCELPGDELTFSEGDQEVKTTARDVFRDILSNLPVPVSTGELATGDGPDFSDAQTVADAITTEIATAKAKGEDLGHAAALARIKARR